MKVPFKAVIEDVVIQPNDIQPIIVNFQHGKLKDEEVGKMSCGLYRDQKKNKSVLALSNGHIVYKGYKPDPKEQLTRTLILLHNKRTGKVRLVEAEKWQVSPVLQKPVIEENKNDTEKKIATLNKQFGSKKVKRKTERYEKMQLDVSSVQEQLEKSVSKVEIDRLDLSTQLPANEHMTNISLPTCNRDVTNVKDVYNVYEIIPRSKLETLYDHAQEILNGSVEGKSKFFTCTLKTIQSDPDNINKISLLLYIEFINAWFAIPLAKVKKRSIVVCPISEEVNEYIVNTYSVPSANGRSRPNAMKDKALIHILIIALTISNFALDLELFRVMLTTRTGLKKLTDLAKIIGAVPDKTDKKIITLKLPLPAPTSLVKSKRKSSVNKQM